MRIKKVSQTTPRTSETVNVYSESTEDSYSCDYVNNDIYYKSGDTFEVHNSGTSFNRIIQPGLLTSAAGALIFTLNVGKSLKNISNITINELNLNIRNYNGGYIESSGYVTDGKDFLTSTYVVTPYIVNDYYITILINKSNSASFSNGTNNTTSNVEIDNLKITFS